MKKIVIISAAILLLAAACNNQAAVQSGNQTGNVNSFSGKLIAGGAECQLFQTDDGKQYTLTGNLAGFKVGDAVNIKGTLQQISTCQQGIGTIGVTSILANQTTTGTPVLPPSEPTPSPLPSPNPCPAGQVPVGTTQGIPGHIICGPANTVTGSSGIAGQLTLQYCGGANPPSGDSGCRNQVGSNQDIAIQNAAGELQHFTSNTDGSFNITLPPGKYIIKSASKASKPKDTAVTVVNGKFTNINLTYTFQMQ